MKGRKPKITQKDFDFIIENRGKLLQTEIAKKIGIGNSHVGEIQRYHLRYGFTTIQEYRNQINLEQNSKYQATTQEKQTRCWETQVDEGVEIYHYVMRRHMKLRKDVYKQLRKDFEEMQRMKKAA